MALHRIYARHSGVSAAERLQIPLIKHCVRTALLRENIDKPCEVSVLITGDQVLRWMNNEYLGIDKPTDVLSFPMQPSDGPGRVYTGPGAVDPETGLIPLGEIVISAPRVITQAKENGHSREREAAYLTIHSLLHLIGYDHVDEAEGKKLMRKREKEILGEIGI